MFHFLDAILPRRCLYCKVSTSSGVFCSICQSLLRGPNRNSDCDVIWAYAYAGILRELILRAKFRADDSITRSLARHLRSQMQTEPFGERLRRLSLSAVTYVPSHWKRRLTRGHEMPGVIAQSLATQLGLPLRHILRCQRFDPPLSTSQSAQERRERLTGRFHLISATTQHSSILLVDDITTTGSTLDTCSEQLRAVGYHVVCFAFAKRLLSHKI